MSNQESGVVSRKDGARRSLAALLVGGLFLVAFLVIFSRSMLRLLNHDEHYYISNGYLLASQGLLPYRDYPYTHMPDLTFVYGLVFTLTDHLLFGARMVSVLSSTLLVILLFWFAYNRLRGSGRAVQLSVASGAVLLLLANPLYAYTSGLAWNHDLPVLLLVLAFFAQQYPLANKGGGGSGQVNLRKALLWNCLSGILVGLTIGTRLSFILVLVPFGLWLLLVPGFPTWQSRLKLILSFGLGVLVGLIPVIITFALAPRQFIFGNFGFFDIYGLYRQETGTQERMVLATKLAYVFEQVASQPGNLLLLFCLVFFGISTEVFARLHKAGNQPEAPLTSPSDGNLLALLLVLFLTISGLTPSPVFYQYFYDLVPFALISIVYGVSRFCALGRAGAPVQDFHPGMAGEAVGRPAAGKTGGTVNWALMLFIQAAILANVFVLPDYAHLAAAVRPANWAPLQVHALGAAIRQEVSEGAVLTLSPLYPLEGGLEIYPQLATGPFIWRAAHWVPQKQRALFGVLAEEDLDDLLVKSPPAAILVGEEKDLEQAFVRYAQDHGYVLKKLPNKLQLWVK